MEEACSATGYLPFYKPPEDRPPCNERHRHWQSHPSQAGVKFHSARSKGRYCKLSSIPVRTLAILPELLV